MQIKSASMMNMMLKQAVEINVMQKQMTQQVQSMKNVMEMSEDVAQMTGKGQAIDLKV